jgi:hypothetical protein
MGDDAPKRARDPTSVMEERMAGGNRVGKAITTEYRLTSIEVGHHEKPNHTMQA